MFLAALFITAPPPKNLGTIQIYPSTGEWINKFWHIYTMKSFPAIKKNELLMHTAT